MINDKYVILEDEDFINADVKKTKTIDIQNFVNEDEIESIYYEQPYYLQPDKSGEKAYGLLRDALKQSGKVGLATFVLRSREGLVVIKPYGKVIVLNRIRFEEEIRDTKSIATPPAIKAKSPELNMAKKLIDQLTTKFDISKYKDTYTDKLLKIIRAKAKSKGKAKPKVQSKLKVVHTKTNDLMETLKASLSKRKKAS